MSAQISSLHIYPIKSCAAIDLDESAIDRAGLAHDRRWMLVTAQGQFMTQRQWPAMARIRPSLEAGSLNLHAPGMPALRIALNGEALSDAIQPVQVWKDIVPAREESAHAHRWFSEFLQVPCTLFKVDGQARRPAKAEWVSAWTERHPDLAPHFAGDHLFGFADGFPLLMANRASLDELNARLAAKGKPAVPMDRFRPNIVVKGQLDAFEEDYAAMLTAGEIRMALVKPCTRCTVPNVDQATGQTYEEPGATLAGYRQHDIGVVFGSNAIVQAPAGARIKVGERVEAVLDF